VWGLIGLLATHFERRLAEGTTAGNIVVGYVAQALGCLTIGNPTNRAAVAHALAHAPRAAGRDDDPAAPLPTPQCAMEGLVGVLQQFLLFQSKANVLTHSALRGLHEVITHVVRDSGIVIPDSPPADDSLDGPS